MGASVRGSFPSVCANKAVGIDHPLERAPRGRHPGHDGFRAIENIDALAFELQAKQYRYAKPTVEAVPWGRVMEVWDPFGNRLRFCRNLGKVIKAVAVRGRLKLHVAGPVSVASPHNNSKNLELRRDWSWITQTQ